MSKAFTKEDDEAGVALTPASSRSVPEGRLRVTATGAARLAASPDPGVRALLGRTEALPSATAPDRAALGVTVRVRDDAGAARTYRIVTPEEQAILGEGCSVESPVGRALLGACPGDVREVRTPRGVAELEVIGLEGEG